MRSIAELSAQANAFEFNLSISFSKWAHVCSSLLRESKVYYAECWANAGNSTDMEHAFVLYLRFADLVLNKLRTHPEFSANKQQYMKIATQVPAAIERSEELKKLLVERPAEPETPAVEVPEVDDFVERELERYAKQDPHAIEGLPRLPPLPRQQPKPQSQPQLPPQPQHQSQHQSQQQSQVQSQSLVPEPRSQADDKDCGVYRTAEGISLRRVFVPKTLRQRFLEIAEPNTKANLEMCAMLCGKLQRNAFFVTDLVVPPQEPTSDSCSTTDEEGLFNYVDQRDLFIIGWIHTHPSQTCFMSSVDLHTHASYQLMLPEAVAVVCAPSSWPDWGAFRLTDPPGIDVIRRCSLTGFHVHDQKNLYRPAGYRELDFPLTAADLR